MSRLLQAHSSIEYNNIWIVQRHHLTFPYDTFPWPQADHAASVIIVYVKRVVPNNPLIHRDFSEPRPFQVFSSEVRNRHPAFRI